jgi:hypothetical protein
MQKLAWIGDALLELDLRLFALDNIGRVDGNWVSEQRSNRNLKVLLCNDGYDTTASFSDAYYGTIFEYLYVEDGDFKERMKVRAFGSDGAKLVTMGDEDQCDGGCWRKLFSGIGSNPLNFMDEPSLSKKQLLQVVSYGTLSTGTFGVVKNGLKLHIVTGSRRPKDIIDGMLNRERLG